ncbi:hypothetical protein ACIODS_11745 [Micromonospora chalcea]|uniref:hypothetical protein n=1 Tax=Micromonospora chalcea TaxID=1874 RepID=UPI003830A845
MTVTSIRSRAAAYTLTALLALTACGSPQPAAQPIATNIPTTAETSPTPAEPPTTAPAATTAAPTVKPAVKPSPTKKRATAPTRKPAPKVTTTKPKPKASTARPPSGQQGVHPGAFCTPVGAIGYTSKGTKMRCTKKDGDIRARWRAA